MRIRRKKAISIADYLIYFSDFGMINRMELSLELGINPVGYVFFVIFIVFSFLGPCFVDLKVNAV